MVLLNKVISLNMFSICRACSTAPYSCLVANSGRQWRGSVFVSLTSNSTRSPLLHTSRMIDTSVPTTYRLFLFSDLYTFSTLYFSNCTKETSKWRVHYLCWNKICLWQELQAVTYHCALTQPSLIVKQMLRFNCLFRLDCASYGGARQLMVNTWL